MKYVNGGRSGIYAVNAVLSDPMGLVPGTQVCAFERRVADFMGEQSNLKTARQCPRIRAHQMSFWCF